MSYTLSNLPSSHSSPSSSPTLATPSPSLDDAPTFTLEKDFYSNFSCCGLALADMHELLNHFEDAHAPALAVGGKLDYSPFSAATTTSSSVAPLANLVISYPQPHPPAEPSSYSWPSETALADDRNYHQYSPASTPYAYSGLGLGFPDLEDTYDPFGFNQLASSSPAAPLTSPSPPLLRINTTFPRAEFHSYNAPSPANSNSPATSAAPYSTAPSPLSVSSISRSSVSSAYSSPNLTAHRNEDHQQNRCLPPALLTLPPQIPRLPPSLTTSLPLIESKPKSHDRGLSLIEPYTIPPSISRRKSGLISAEDTQKVERDGVGPQRTIPAHIHTHAQTGRPPSFASGAGRRRRDGREKAFKCPHPGCTKSYLNPNGLKYHLEKGTCSIDPTFVLFSADASRPQSPAEAQDTEQAEPQAMAAPTPIALPSVPPVSPITPV
jgi:transcription factor SFP1